MTDRQVLSPIAIEALDHDGTATMIEPGLDVITCVGWAVDLGMLIMRNTDFFPLGVPDEVCGTFQRLHLANDRDGRSVPSELCQTLLFTQRA